MLAERVCSPWCVLVFWRSFSLDLTGRAEILRYESDVVSEALAKVEAQVSRREERCERRGN